VRTGGNGTSKRAGVVICASWSSTALEYCLPLVRCGGKDEDEDGRSELLFERCGCGCREDREGRGMEVGSDTFALPYLLVQACVRTLRGRRRSLDSESVDAERTGKEGAW
jgi:hypothetical protein